MKTFTEDAIGFSLYQDRRPLPHPKTTLHLFKITTHLLTKTQQVNQFLALP